MFPVSLQYKDTMKHLSKTWDIKLSIKLSNGTVLSITGNDIKGNTVQFTEGSTCTDKIQVGATFSNGFDFTLLNNKGQFSNYDFTNAEVAPSVGLWIEQKKAFEYVPLGIFNIVDSPKKLSTIAINCLDSMCKANVPFDFFDMVYPANAADVLHRACVKCGFNVSEAFEAEVRNLNISIHSFETSGITCRDIIASSAALIAKNARLSRDNVLEAFWYSDEGATTTPSTRIGSSTYEDKVLQVTQVIISDNYEQVYSYGDEGYTIELSSNPFIQSPEIAESVLSRILERLRSVNVQQCKVCTVGDPTWQASDIVTHERPGFSNVTVPIMKIVYKYGGSMTLDTLGEIPEEVAQPTKQERKIMHLKDKSAKDYEYMESKIEQTSREVRIEIQTIRHDGVNKVSTATGYTFDEDGLKIKRTGSEMSTLISQDGMQVFRSDEAVLTANNSGVSATNLHATTYLIVGKNSRFEDYGERTGCFWIGGVD